MYLTIQKEKVLLYLTKSCQINGTHFGTRYKYQVENSKTENYKLIVYLINKGFAENKKTFVGL